MKKMFALFLILFISHGSAHSQAQGQSKVPSADPKLLSDWIGLQLKLIRITKGITQGHVTRQFSLNSIVFYECLISGDKQYVSLSGQLQQLGPLPASTLSVSVAPASANAGYAFMLRTFFGDDQFHQKQIDSLESVYVKKYMSEGLADADIQAAAAHGKAVALHILQWSKGDGSAIRYAPYQVPEGEGKWQTTPPAYLPAAAQQMVYFRSMVTGSSNNSLPPPPVPFSIESTSPFYAMVKEVYDVQQKLTPEQKAIALFWDDFPNGKYYGGVGHWCSILRQVLVANKTDLKQGAEAFAKMTIAASDAQLACWKGKYHYNVLRPITYIRKYMGAPEWESLIITPNHPEYPAAHATISTAAATALADVLGQAVSFQDHTYDDIGYKPRTFANFKQAASEAGRSRLYGGIHYTPSIDAGAILGTKVASSVLGGLKFRKK